MSETNKKKINNQSVRASKIVKDKSKDKSKGKNITKDQNNKRNNPCNNCFIM
jgi:hypothetical protein